MEVRARDRWNDTGLEVRKGDRIRITASGTWTDSRIPSGPDGFGRWWLAPLRWTRRCRTARWFELIAVVGTFKGPCHRIGSEGSFVADRDGRVQLFANDAWIAYGNNHGSIEARIEKLT